MSEIPALPGGRLEVAGLTRSFGGLVAVDELTLVAEPGAITALIGPNGAGKTTVFNCVTGNLTPDRGRILLDGRDLTRTPPHRRVRAGLARTFQRLEVFSGMTVADNLRVAAESRTPVTPLRGLLALTHPEDTDITSEVHRVLDILGLSGLADTRAGELSTGVLRLVELGRALCTHPSVLLLDEPGSGLDSAESARLGGILAELAAAGLTVLLVEHDIELVLALSQTIYVLEFGRLLARGTPEEIRADTAVQRAYVGALG